MIRLLTIYVVLLLGACEAGTPDATVDDAPHSGEHPYHAIPSGAPQALDDVRRGAINRFEFAAWAGPPIPVWLYVPESADLGSAPVLFMMHGAKRDPHRYLREWVGPAEESGIVVVAPEFSKQDFPGSPAYNRGYVFDADGQRRNEQLWTFSAIEPLFDTVRGMLGSSRETYTLYGHSAGSQFVHRYLYFKPSARVDRILAANAGWYTYAHPGTHYPYGLGESGVAPGTVDRALAANVVVLLGNEDNDPAHESLRRTPEAMLQGPHRLARGLSFYAAGKQLAESRDVPFHWQLVIVDGVAHQNGGMALAAADFVPQFRDRP